MKMAEDCPKIVNLKSDPRNMQNVYNERGDSRKLKESRNSSLVVISCG